MHGIIQIKDKTDRIKGINISTNIAADFNITL